MWQGLLQGLGSVLSFFYDLIPSYGVAIIALTVAVRVVLLPLTIKQTRSMQAMQKVQPHVKALQQKYKGNRQKLNEEMMKLYKEHRVNPLGGCLPLLLQLPVFFALFSVLRSADPGNLPGTQHLPEQSRLVRDIGEQQADFLGMNLACAPTQAGRGQVVLVKGAEPVDCGKGVPASIPFYSLVALMVFTTWYQQRQMQAAAGPQAQGQMQLMGRIMPIFLGFISISISAGVLVYWVTTNGWQIGQQYVMLRSRVAPQAEERPAPKPSGGKKGGSRNAGGRKKRPKR